MRRHLISSGFFALAVSAQTCLQLKEGETQTLSCPPAQNVYALTFADFGNVLGNCTSGFTSSPSCTTAPRAMALARQLCLGKPSCALESSNAVWGPDPCPGYPKSLAISAKCDGAAHCYAMSFTATLGDFVVLQQAPAAAAVYGTVTGNTTAVTVTVTDAAGAAYAVPAAVAADGTWKALLRPAPAGGDFNITATAVCATESVSAVLLHATFGDVWYCGGQSNMALPLQNTLSRNLSLAAIAGGKYHNIRVQQLRGNMNPDTPWTPIAQAAASPNASVFLAFSGTCYYFGQALTDALGAAAPPIGLVHVAWGGSTIQQWVSNDTLNANVCANHSSGQGNDGGWWESRVLPYRSMTLKGWIW